MSVGKCSCWLISALIDQSLPGVRTNVLSCEGQFFCMACPVDTSVSFVRQQDEPAVAVWVLHRFLISITNAQKMCTNDGVVMAVYCEHEGAKLIPVGIQHNRRCDCQSKLFGVW